MGFLESTTLYNFLRGPMVWVAFTIFVLGSIYRIITLINLAKKEKVIFPFINGKASIKSILHWLTPFGSRNWRLKPYFTIFTFLFHTGLIFVPIFLYAHNVLWYESWGISWCTLPDAIADVWTVFVIAGCIFFIGRRIFDPTVRFVTNFVDFIFIFICLFTFLTGFFAHYPVILPYRAMLNLHLMFGEIMLISIPFTRLTHMYYFFMTRAYMASQFALWKTKDW